MKLVRMNRHLAVLEETINRVSSIGVTPDDTRHTLLLKAIGNLSSVFGGNAIQIFLGCVAYRFAETNAAYAVWSGALCESLLTLVIVANPNFYWRVTIAVLVIPIVSSTSFVILVGNIHYSGFSCLWGMIAPLLSALFYSRKITFYFLMGFFSSIILIVFSEPYLRVDNNIPTEWWSIVSIVNIFGVTLMVVLALLSTIHQRDKAYDELKDEKSALDSMLIELRHAQEKALVASDAKSAFLTNMSHEIRTPLNAIIGMAYALKRMIIDPLPSEMLTKIDRAAQHLLSLVNDILDISKIEAGKLSINPDHFSLEQLISGVMDQMSHKAAENGVELIVGIAPDLPDMLYGDALRVKQCLINYVGNAIKFTHDGSVSIRVSKDAATNDDLSILFEVEDTGIGIAPAALSRLFNAFEQADQSTTRQFGGTGLGLSLTKQFAELMGGRVGADSLPGKGSRFWFTVLLQESKETDRNAQDIGRNTDSYEKVLALDCSSFRVLVAEDMPLNRDVLKYMLDELNIKADMAEDGKIAVAMACETTYDLILMDMQMPVMDGISATESIRKLSRYADVPIIALTANAFVEDRETCLNAGMNDFLSKPVQAEMFQAMLLKWLKQAVPKISRERSKTNQSTRLACLDDVADIDKNSEIFIQLETATCIRILQEYADTYADVMSRFRDKMTSGDRAEAREMAHALSGTSGMVGVVGIQDLAAELEIGLRHDMSLEQILKLTEEIDTRMAIVCAAIRAIDEDHPLV